MTESRFKELLAEVGISQELIKSFWDAKPERISIADLTEDQLREVLIGGLHKWRMAEELLKTINKTKEQ